jgi:hypothetical protein
VASWASYVVNYRAGSLRFCCVIFYISDAEAPAAAAREDSFKLSESLSLILERLYELTLLLFITFINGTFSFWEGL